ncbi:hypothetical protein COT08_01380 [Candidatus Woesebacteria bacterium CG07_land_8_20_14_0_80_44_9]|uniref:Class I SAM-dependent methyltransferase n=1 Tax=Candidatus Woesebacteria bacterium CG07_land_8_20_14_0_80_44_9 TaxID=1975058 RepID=A0A2M6YE34_9BACT|nr:MAG: hypothetical protein COT08_01380 [Candidatus Woesebacteria bacterium CG07_land_8_20_14_0_80_44_9]
MNYHRDEDYLKFEKTFRNIFQKRVNLISRFAGKGKVLEVGCATGVMLKLFREQGWQVLGVEPSGSAKVAQKKGLKVWRHKFEGARLPNGYFDLAVLNHTLEHMDNPPWVLRKVNRLLKEDGIVFIDVPNAGGLGAKLLGKHWPYRLPREHKWQFTRQSLASLLTDAGFRVLHWQSRSGIFEYANPLLELKRKCFLFDILTSPYALIASILRRGDSMSFIARKK